MATIKKKETTPDYTGVASLIKWSAIGFLFTAGTAGTVILLAKRGIKESKKDNAYEDTTAVNTKGKTVNSVIGAGKTASSYAILINSALKDTTWGIPDSDEEEVLKNIKELKTQYEVALVSKAYESLYKMTLSEGLQKDLDSDELNPIINLIASKPAK